MSWFFFIAYFCLAASDMTEPIAGEKKAPNRRKSTKMNIECGTVETNFYHEKWLILTPSNDTYTVWVILTPDTKQQHERTHIQTPNLISYLFRFHSLELEWATATKIDEKNKPWEFRSSNYFILFDRMRHVCLIATHHPNEL